MFSVIIPLFNKESSINNTLQSVLNQTYSNFEILIVNDGSTDRSLANVEEFTDSRIRIISKTNGGVSSARNVGIDNARFEWISFLDADDYWEDFHLMEMKIMIENFPDNLIFGTNFKYSNAEIKSSEVTEYLIIIDYFREVLNNSLLCSSSIVINKKCFKNVGVFNEKLSRGEDLEMWARLSKVYKILKSTKVTAVYRLDAENRATDLDIPINKSVLSIVSLKNTRGFERRYYKKLILKKIRFSFKQKDFRSVFFLLKKFNFSLI